MSDALFAPISPPTGEEETPVFALPVLLRLDSEAEALFQHTFHWHFKCSVCGHTSRSRYWQSSGVAPDWAVTARGVLFIQYDFTVEPVESLFRDAESQTLFMKDEGDWAQNL